MYLDDDSYLHIPRLITELQAEAMCIFIEHDWIETSRRSTRAHHWPWAT